jgi:hypothetical protein
MTDIQFTSGSRKASIWQQHLIQWQSSGLTQKAYCQEHNLSHRQFLYWRARQKQGQQGLATPVCSVPVSVLATVSELTVAPQQIELLIGVATMRIPVDVSPLYLAQLVSALQ